MRLCDTIRLSFKAGQHRQACGSATLAPVSILLRNQRRLRGLFIGFVVVVLLSLLGSVAHAQLTVSAPHLGYAFPSGGQQGSMVQIVIKGQYLRAANDAVVAGDGVRASVVGYVPPQRPVNRKDLKEFVAKLRELLGKKDGDLSIIDDLSGSMAMEAKSKETKSDNPAIQRLEKMNRRELEYIAGELRKPRAKKQKNAQLGEAVLLDITIDRDAEPGEREIRLTTNWGITNPVRFQVGQLAEDFEVEPNNIPRNKIELYKVPCVLNGQVEPGDVDRFRFEATKGQHLVIDCFARRLVPYLADAVPGWFQAVLAIYDSEGNELAFADDYRFDPDPAMLFEVPRDGEYQLEIRDSIYRGREDFVYRIEISEKPFITSIFPMGGREGSLTNVAAAGWNLSSNRIFLDTDKGTTTGWARVESETMVSNMVPYSVDDVSECEEVEPNETARRGQKVLLPQIVNGRIGSPGDVDRFQFSGREGEKIVIDVNARRLRSPLDSVVRLLDESGEQIAFNDDRECDMIGLQTHEADSYLAATLPKKGAYCVEISDAQNQGGDEYGYRLRIGPPEPDFEVYILPSSLLSLTGRSVPITARAVRKDGFDGDIELFLKDAPIGFSLGGATIPGDRNEIGMTLLVPVKAPEETCSLQLEARADVGSRTVFRPVVPGDEMMQAFAYMHLVPAQELRVLVRGKRVFSPLLQLASNIPVEIPAGGTTQVRVTIPRRGGFDDMELELSDPPEGVSLKDVKVQSGRMVLTLEAEDKPGLSDNLIVQAFKETVIGKKGDKDKQRKKRLPVGALPAIPFTVVER